MTKPKKKNKKFILLIIFSVLYFYPFLSTNAAECKKFDIKCKTNKFVSDTMEFQKEGLKKGIDQLSITKDKVINVIPKKN